MALLKRFNQLLHADIHAMLDQIEDPSALLKQSIREMEAALLKNQLQLQQLQSDHERLTGVEASLSTELCRIEESLDLAIDAKDDALAKNLVRRKLQSTNLLQTIKSQNQQRLESIAKQEKQILQQQMTIDGLKQKCAALTEPSQPISCSDDFAMTITADDIDIALLREKQRRANKDKQGGAQ
ncbi:MAG: PspA/IM30 family protein [Hahellaceae bacterium]|nr:PspA/IM30 family protein [Hahellaceae bacterium]MCP5212766.1 PspA/IM30 family protein [Hahellaceae bacterium]